MGSLARPLGPAAATVPVSLSGRVASAVAPRLQFRGSIMLRRLAGITLAILASSPLAAATRMTWDINGMATPIAWDATAFPLRYQVDARLLQSHPAAAQMVSRAFASWESIESAEVRFLSDGAMTASAATSPDRITVSLADDLFSGQGAAAVTSYKYDTQTGRMIDADILVDPSVFGGAINGQMALQHEVGHILGLDHSAVLSSIMYPYVGPGDAPADLDDDDRIAIAAMYPKGDPALNGATLTGRVTGDRGGVFAAQVVAVNANGQPVSTVLTNAAGEFSIVGIPAGSYRLYAEPLDGPVEPAALQGTWRQARVDAFPTQFYGTPLHVESGNVYGNLVLTTAGTIALNPRWIGVAPEGRADVSLSTSPAAVSPGQTVTITVAGDGFTSGMTQFEVLNPAFRRISDYSWASNYVRATYAIAPDASPTSTVVVVRSGNETAMLTGALRVYRGAARTRAVRR